MAAGPSRVARAMAWAEARGHQRGLRGASGTWLAVWVLASGYRHLKKLAAPQPVVVRERLAPGQQLLITHFAEGAETPPDPEPPRRRRRRTSS